MPADARPRLAAAWPALLATVVLLIVLLGGYAVMESRRLQRNLGRELEDRGSALIGVLDASSKNAIAGQALLEEVLAQRLLDNARFVDSFVSRSPHATELIQRIVQENRLARIDLLDQAGNPLSGPPADLTPADPARELPPRAGRGPRWGGQPGGGPREGTEASRPPRMMRRMSPPAEHGAPDDPEAHRPRGMPFMWGQRWGMRGDPTLLFPALPKDATIRRFWEGSEFGVAVPAQSFAGIIAVHAGGDYLLHFRSEVGLQRLIEDLARQAGVAGADLLDSTLTVLASSDRATVGRQADDPFLRDALQAGGVRGRRVTRADGREVYEVTKPLAIEKDRTGLVRLALGTEGLAAAAAQAQRGILWYSAGLLLVGIAGAVAIFWLQARHLHERRALEAAMVREQRLSAMGNLAAGVAHEIRNPLNAISIGLQRLRLEFAPAAASREEYDRFTRLMQSEVARLNTIVDRFLALARPLRLALTEEPVGPLLKEVTALLASQAAAQGVEIREEIRLDDGRRVRADRQQLTQAFMNVLLNALQAMPGGGVLTLRAQPARGPSGPPRAEIRIADTGPGIPPDHLDRIFEPYFTTKEGGTGLGLALTRKILQEHGGDIRVEAGHAGGAVFVIALPLTAAGDGKG